MIAVCGDKASAPLGLQTVLSHRATEFRAVHHHALVAKGRPDATVSVALELVADYLDLAKKTLARVRHRDDEKGRGRDLSLTLLEKLRSLDVIVQYAGLELADPIRMGCRDR